jgi:hypothetical protein
MKNEDLLAELEGLLRTMPPREEFRSHMIEDPSWLGRAAAVVTAWDFSSMVWFRQSQSQLQSFNVDDIYNGYQDLATLLHQARTDIKMKTVGPTNVAISGGMPFDYFDEIRQVIKTATSDILFVDPYLDAEFVERYLPHITAGIRAAYRVPIACVMGRC